MMSMQRPKPWSSLLQFDNKTWTDIDRKIIIIDKLEHWSEFNFFIDQVLLLNSISFDAWNLSMIPMDTRIVLLITFSSRQD